MKVTADINIDKPIADVWGVITDIEHAQESISSIEDIRVLKKPDQGIEGLTWEETRVMFGKEAKETMTITQVEELHSYMTHAQSHGSIYETMLEVEEIKGLTHLSMTFEGTPQTFGTKLLYWTMGRMFLGATKKALLKDLEDIKHYAETH